MADFGDEAQERTEKHLEASLKARKPRPYEAGLPGECEMCGLQKNRLVRRGDFGMVCAGCRTRYRLG